MGQQPIHHPPRWATRFLSWYCRPELLEDLEGDLNEYFERNVRSSGIRKARLIYVADVLKFMRLYTVRRPQSINPLISWIMIGSYLKTARRNLVRNKLFSTINIIGLAVSMSVGLLMIAFVSDLLSYDDFHENKARVYRLNSHDERDGRVQMTLATTSVKAGKEIRESIAGVEAVTIVRNDFGGDAVVGDAKLPVSGYWADESFFKVLSFPFVAGDPATALKEPYAIVLTEKTALKLYGTTEALGKALKFDTTSYVVTGVIRDIPKLSHIHFDMLGSFSTAELRGRDPDGGFMNWNSIYMSWVYLLLPEGGDAGAVQAGIDKMCAQENKALEGQKIHLKLQPLTGVSLGQHLSNEIGPVMHIAVVWVLAGLAFVVILSACFNYTNLSIARALRRSREVGIRKIVGAQKRQVLVQFITEAVVVALLALVFSFVLFAMLRREFIGLDPYIERLVSLELSWRVVLYFIGMAMVTGLVAGFLPALLFSRLQAAQVLKGTTSLRLFRRVNLRKALVVVQYVFSLIFITTTVIGYNQYKGFVAFDLGFKTENVLNIWMHGNKSDVFIHDLEAMPEVRDISQSVMVTSLGSKYGTSVKYDDAQDSVGTASLNFVDDRYLTLHEHVFLAGRNFVKKPFTSPEDEVIVTEGLVKHFHMGEPQEALGEQVTIDRKKLTIVGVLKDFHYETILNKIEPTVFRYDPAAGYRYVNVKINSKDLPATMARIEAVWKKVDKVHALDAKFYDDQIEHAYAQFSVMVKVIGFLAFLAVCIASMGLFGMVVFTTETKLKEISIRKVLGAGEGNLVVLMSRGFLLLLVAAAVIALPATYVFFDRVVLVNFAYHEPIRWLDMVLGLAGVLVIAALMIGSQTLKVARANPAMTLKNE